MILHFIFFLVGCIVAGITTKIIVTKRLNGDIDELTSNNLFLASLLKKEWPDWEVFNGIHCPLVDKYRQQLGDILYKKFFTNHLDFVGLEKFVKDMNDEVYCGGKENLLRGILKEVVANFADTNTEGLAKSITDFVDNNKDDVSGILIVISHAVQDVDRLVAKQFMELLQKRTDELLVASDSTEKRNRILEMQFIMG